MLTIVTTHLKTGYTKRNGIPSSDKRTSASTGTLHGNYLTVVVVRRRPGVSGGASDPQFTWVPIQPAAFNPSFCEPAPEVPAPWEPCRIISQGRIFSDRKWRTGMACRRKPRAAARRPCPEYRLKMASRIRRHRRTVSDSASARGWAMRVASRK